MNHSTSRSWSARAQSVLRIVAAFLFMLHGTTKWFGVPATNPGFPVQLPSWLGAAAVIETVGGAFLLLGLFARPVAFICAGEMACAYFSMHAPRSALPIVNGGEPAVLFCFIWLCIAATGPGPWSLDALRGRRRP